MNRRVFSIAVAFSFAMFASVASAVTIAPGGAALTNGTSLGADGSLNNGLVIASNATPFIGVDSFANIKFTGTLYANVVREASGTLSFYYQIHNDLTSLDAIERFTNQSFTGFSTNADYRTDAQLGTTGGSGLVGTVGSRFATRSSTGAVVGFNFWSTTGFVPQGADTYWHVIRTDATLYTSGSTALLNGGIATVQTFAPIVPEPGSLALLGLGALMLRRRK